MISFRGSPALEPSPDCLPAPRPERMDNVEWLGKQVKALRREGIEDSFVVLLGGRRSVYDFRLQVAQSHIRGDLTPSHWSHVAMLSTRTTNLGSRSRVLEVSLEPYEGFQVPSMHNGLQAAPLSRYASADIYSNIALIRVPVRRTEWQDNHDNQKSILAQFADQRSVLDVTSLMLEWLAFVWGSGDAGNPLLNGHGVPSAAVIESLLGAAGYDVSPGLETAASSPEAFWQTAKWWHTYYEAMGLEQMVTRYVIADETAAAEAADDGEPAPRKAVGKKPAKKAAKKAAAASAAEQAAAARPRGLSGLRLPEPKMLAERSMTAAMFRN